MDIIEFQVTAREELGKNKVSKIRQKGMLPSIIYGLKKEPQAITLDPKELTKVYRSHSGINSIIRLTITSASGSITEDVISHDIELDALSGKLEHVDFMRIDLNTPINTHVPVKLIGTSVGEKLGGQRMQHLDTLHISCLPTNIPDTIDVVVTELNMGQTFRVRDLNLDSTIKVLTAGEEAIVHVEAIKSNEEAAS